MSRGAAAQFVAGLGLGLCAVLLLGDHMGARSSGSVVQSARRSRIRSRLPPRPDWSNRRAVLQQAFQWARRWVPYFECADADITTAYYYRWRVFWLHLRRTPRYGWVLTEFLRDVPWSGPHGTINCAFGHHAAEGRWVKDRAVLDNYSHFWFRHPQASLRYTWWPAQSALERFRVDGRRSRLAQLRPHLEQEYWRWVGRSVVGTGSTRCVWQACHDDGEENSVGLDGCRPTINAAIAGEALALSTM